MKRLLIGMAAVLVSGLWALQSTSAADGVYVVKPVAEKRVTQLPDGPLYWRIENFPTLAQAQAAIGPGRWNPNTVSYDSATALAVEVAGKDWLFTLGPKGGSTPGGTEVAEIGPVPPISAPEYLLRINYGSGPPEPGHHSIAIRAPNPSTLSPVSWARELLRELVMSTPATR
jgi:hypothetical protein